MKDFYLAQAMEALILVAFAFANQSAYAQNAPLLCKGQLTYTFPDGKQTFALYYIKTHQRYPGDCFPELCPAKCTFETPKRPAKEKVVEAKEIEHPVPAKDVPSK